MSTQLEAIAFLRAERREILEAALDDVTSPHYDAAGALIVRQRVETLFDCMLGSLVAGDITPIVAHARRIAEERFDAGYDLAEVQDAFNALEAAVWARVAAVLPPGQLERTLGLVTTILGAGKDALARTYVSRAGSTHAPSLDLGALSAGTSA